MSKLILALLTVTLSSLSPVGTEAADPSPAASPGAAAPVQMANGLEYTDLVVGNGPAAKVGDTVSIAHTIYIGERRIEQSKPGEPMVFAVGKGLVLKGIDAGVPGMKAGGKRRLIVPPSLGYGAEAVRKVPANSTMIIDVELLELKP